MANPPLQYRSIIFDLDGTLLISNIDFETLRSRLGVPQNESILDWLDSLPEIERTEGHKLLRKIEAEAAQNSQVQEGSQDLLEWIRNEEIPFGILTRNTRSTWNVVSARFPFLQPDRVVTREEAEPKPQPESLSPFLSRWEIDPVSIVHVGDYRYDLELAHRTGMHSVLLQASGVNPYTIPCNRTVRDLRELLEYLKSIPFEKK